jgi:broad specificity phosphatase PhoE
VKLYLARHTQTNYNEQKLCNADPLVDVHLTKLGKRQAQNLAEQLKDADFEVIYVSELPRTRETAEIINQFHRKSIIVDGRINDNRTGFESKPVQDYLNELVKHENRYDVVLNDGESLNQAAARSHAFLDEVKQGDYPSVLVVTHGFIIEAIHAYIFNLSIEEGAKFQLAQGEFVEFNI